MPKRRHCGKEERWRQKIKKYQEKIARRNNVSSCEDDEDGYVASPHLWESLQSPERALESVIVTPSNNKGVVTDAESVLSSCEHSVMEQSVEPEAVHAHAPAPAFITAPANLGSEAAPELADVPPTDPELLLALGTFDENSNEWGPDISEDLARRWEPILKDGLKNEVIEDFSKKFLYPMNCPLVKPPVLNLEISAMLNEPARNRDVRILKKQDHLACALTVLGGTMTKMLTKSIDTPNILRNLCDATKIIAHAHYSETETRRSLVTPMLDKSFVEPFKNRKRDAHLFGDKLSDFIKTSCGIQKTGKLLQSTSGNLNSKAPLPPRAQTQYRGPRFQNRGGGARAAPAYHRRPAPYHARAAAGRGRRAPTPPLPSTSQRSKQSAFTKRKQ